MTFAEAIDALLQLFASDQEAGEISKARKEFNEMTGGPFDQSADDFEMKMSQFADWYLFERQNEASGLAPVFTPLAERFAHEKNFPEQLKALQQSRSSLFEFLKVKGSDVFIRDLLANEKVVVPNSNMILGFQRDEYFQARLFKEGDFFQFGPAFCFHPGPASRYLNKEIKRFRKLKEEAERASERASLLLKLFKMKYKLQQYKHVDVKDIYSDDPKLRF